MHSLSPSIGTGAQASGHGNGGARRPEDRKGRAEGGGQQGRQREVGWAVCTLSVWRDLSDIWTGFHSTQVSDIERETIGMCVGR